MSKTYYKCKMIPTEDGLNIYTYKYISIHETRCFHFCIQEMNRGFLSAALTNENENACSAMRRMGIKVFKIAKSGSRIASESENDALQRMIYMKKRQLCHMNRDIEFIQLFLSYCDGKSLDEIPVIGNFKGVPNSKELVAEYYRFD